MFFSCEHCTQYEVPVSVAESCLVFCVLAFLLCNFLLVCCDDALSVQIRSVWPVLERVKMHFQQDHQILCMLVAGFNFSASTAVFIGLSLTQYMCN